MLLPVDDFWWAKEFLTSLRVLGIDLIRIGVVIKVICHLLFGAGKENQPKCIYLVTAMLVLRVLLYYDILKILKYWHFLLYWFYWRTIYIMRSSQGLPYSNNEKCLEQNYFQLSYCFKFSKVTKIIYLKLLSTPPRNTWRILKSDWALNLAVSCCSWEPWSVHVLPNPFALSVVNKQQKPS